MAVRDILAVVAKLAVASLIVGLLLSWLDINPRMLLRDLPELLRDMIRLALSTVDWALPYILLGAVIVVPVWGAFALLRVLRRR